jgi:hypothetical protein
MHKLLIAFPLLFVATPAAAQQTPSMPRALEDPALPEKLGRATEVLTQSLMNLPVGELEAAIEGRPVTQADKQKRVRDSVGDPNLDRRVGEQAAASGRAMQAASKALVASLPSIMAALEQAQQGLERAVANIPDPTYPRR